MAVDTRGSGQDPRTPALSSWSNKYNNAARIARRAFVPELASVRLKVIMLIPALNPLCRTSRTLVDGAFVCACGASDLAEEEAEEWTLDVRASRAANDRMQAEGAGCAADVESSQCCAARWRPS